ncbi:MAG: hypothetical protein AAFV85_19455 [Cyanobacteria bacterium J06634_6]
MAKTVVEALRDGASPDNYDIAQYSLFILSFNCVDPSLCKV